MAGDALVDRSDECSSTCHRYACARKCPGQLGTTDIYRMIRHTQAPVGLLLTEQAKAQMHIVGSLMHCRRRAHGLHIDLEEINSQYVIARRRTDGNSYAGATSRQLQSRADQREGGCQNTVAWYIYLSMASTARRGEASFLLPCLLEICCVPNGAPNDTNCQTSAVDLVRRQD